MTARTSYGSCRVDVDGERVTLVLVSPHGAEVVCSTWHSPTPHALARMVLRGEAAAYPVAS